MQGVTGSSPVVSTKNKKTPSWCLFIFDARRRLEQLRVLREFGSHTPLEDRRACSSGAECEYIAHRAKSGCRHPRGVFLFLTRGTGSNSFAFYANLVRILHSKIEELALQAQSVSILPVRQNPVVDTPAVSFYF